LEDRACGTELNEKLMARGGWSSPSMVVHCQHASPERDRPIANGLDNLAMDNSFADESHPIAPEDHKDSRHCSRNPPLAASLVGRPGLDPGTLGLKEGPVRPERSTASIGPIRVGCRVQRACSRAPGSRQNSSNTVARRAAPAEPMMDTLATVRERARNTTRRGGRAGRAAP